MVMHKHNYQIIFFLLLSLTFSSYLNCMPLFEVDFESDSEGSLPTSKTYQTGQYSLFPSHARSVMVVNQATSEAGTPNKAVEFKATAKTTSENFPLLRLDAENNDDASESGNVIASWDMNISSQARGAAIIRILGSMEGRHIAELHLNLEQGTISIKYYNPNSNQYWGSIGGRILQERFSFGKNLHFEWHLNLDRDKNAQTLYLDQGIGMKNIGTLDLLSGVTATGLSIHLERPSYANSSTETAFIIDNISTYREPSKKLFNVNFDNTPVDEIPDSMAYIHGIANRFPTVVNTGISDILIKDQYQHSSGTFGGYGDHVAVINHLGLDKPSIGFMINREVEKINRGKVIINWVVAVDAPLHTQGDTIRFQALHSESGLNGEIYLKPYSNEIYMRGIDDGAWSNRLIFNNSRVEHVFNLQWEMDFEKNVQSICLYETPGKCTILGSHGLPENASYGGFRSISIGSHSGSGFSYALNNIEISLEPPVYAFELYLDRFQTEEHYHNIISDIAEKGYNTLIMGGGKFFERLETVAVGISSINEKNPKKAFTKKQIAHMIRYARGLGLEVVLELKLINKMYSALMGQDYDFVGGSKSCALENYNIACHIPELLETGDADKYSKLINLAYRTSENVNIFDLVLHPIIDELLTLYGARMPKYIHLGMDEINVRHMRVYADQLDSVDTSLREDADRYHMTIEAALFSRGLNSLFNHVLEKGITPLIWGDMLLSSSLSDSDDTGTGVYLPDGTMRQGDMRFLSINSYNAEMQSPRINNRAEYSLLTAINGIERKSEVIICDWHYYPGHFNSFTNQMEFPSIDYFQDMGFKDVWGTTWYDENTVKGFSEYAFEKNAGGMIAGSWSADIPTKQKREVFPGILNNSIIYFKNPHYRKYDKNIPIYISSSPSPIQKKHPLALLQDSTYTIYVPITSFTVPTHSVTIHLSRSPTSQSSSVDRSTPISIKLTPNIINQTGVLSGEFSLSNEGIYDLRLEASYTTYDGYKLTESHLRAIIAGNPPTQQMIDAACNYKNIPAESLFVVDFSCIPILKENENTILAAGKYPGILYLEQPLNSIKTTESGAHYLSPPDSGLTYFYPPHELWKEIEREGAVITTIVEVESQRMESNKGNVTIFSYGSMTAKTGFSLLLREDGVPYFQIQRSKDYCCTSVYVETPYNPLIGAREPIPYDLPVKITIKISPPNHVITKTRSVSITVKNMVTGQIIESGNILMKNVMAPSLEPFSIGATIKNWSILQENPEESGRMPGKIHFLEIEKWSI